MTIYVYRCRKCGKQYEQKVTEQPIPEADRKCKSCKADKSTVK